MTIFCLSLHVILNIFVDLNNSLFLHFRWQAMKEKIWTAKAVITKRKGTGKSGAEQCDLRKTDKGSSIINEQEMIIQRLKTQA